MDVVRAALEGGAGAIQLREKTLGARDTLALAWELRRVTCDYDALLFVNDRFDLALAVGADGVHLGPTDVPVEAVRAVASPPFLIGYSTDDPEVAEVAVREGADYLGVGTVFPTDNKSDAGLAIGPAGLARVARAVAVPVVAIGGITPDRAATLGSSGASGVAVLGAVMGAPDPTAATRALVDAVRRWS